MKKEEAEQSSARGEYQLDHSAGALPLLDTPGQSFPFACLLVEAVFMVTSVAFRVSELAEDGRIQLIIATVWRDS